jgi:hypothetical protein
LRRKLNLNANASVAPTVETTLRSALQFLGVRPLVCRRARIVNARGTPPGSVVASSRPVAGSGGSGRLEGSLYSGVRFSGLRINSRCFSIAEACYGAELSRRC